MVCARLSSASRGTLCAALCTAVSALFTPRDGGAQNVRPDSARPRPRPTSSQGRLAVTGCSGQPISDIVILSQPPFKDRLPAQLEWGRTLARTLHMETRDDVIRGFLLFKVGDACNQIKRAESERILRAQPFIVDARIRAYDDEKGGVRLEVETRDDFTLIVEPRVRTSSPQFRGIRLGDANVNGSAALAAVEWRDGLAYNDVWASSTATISSAGTQRIACGAPQYVRPTPGTRGGVPTTRPAAVRVAGIHRRHARFATTVPLRVS